MNDFKHLKTKGIIRGFLLGFFCVGLYFYPFISREEILTSAIDKTPRYITVFWDFLRILMMIFFEVGMFQYYVDLRQNCQHYQTRSDFDVQDEKEIISSYMYLGALTVVLSGLAVLIVQAIAQLLLTFF